MHQIACNFLKIVVWVTARTPLVLGPKFASQSGPLPSQILVARLHADSQKLLACKYTFFL